MRLHFLVPPQEGVDVLVATPGRVATLLEAEALSLVDCRAIVLDEVCLLLFLARRNRVHRVIFVVFVESPFRSCYCTVDGRPCCRGESMRGKKALPDGAVWCAV